MIEREIAPHLIKLFRQYPFVTVTGPRQSGKTTLCRAAFPDLAYVDLDAPDEREFANSDPRSFLDRFPDGTILDEVQRFRGSRAGSSSTAAETPSREAAATSYPYASSPTRSTRSTPPNT